MNLYLDAPSARSVKSAVAERSRSAVLTDLLPPTGVFDTRALLGHHPELRANKSLLLDVVFEEVCRRQEAGEVLNPDEFSARFPSYQASVGRLLQVYGFLDERSFLTDHGQPIAWPMPGGEFLGFALLRELGRGSFARVFLAAESALGGRQVAVKVSKHGTAEAATLGRLSHPHIVPIYSVQTDERTGLSAVCMPYLGSVTLCDLLD